MLEISWDTYIHRRELRWLGCIFSYPKKSYIGNSNNLSLIKFCEEKWLKTIYVDEAIELDEKFEVEQKNIRAEYRANKYRVKAEVFEQKAEKEDVSKSEHDFLSLAEPIKVWHHSEGRHRRLLDRLRKKMDNRIGFYNKSEEAERKAYYRENKRYFTEDEKKERKQRVKKLRETAEQLWASNHKTGDEYIGWHCSWTIKKINAKTVILESGTKMEIAYSRDFDLFLKKAKENEY